MCANRYYGYAALMAAVLTWGGLLRGQSPPPPTVVIDPKVHPVEEYLSGSVEQRPLAAVVDSFGNRADFTVNEVLFATADDAIAKAFAARWKGRVVSRVDTSKALRKAKPKYPVIYLIHIDSSYANPAILTAALRAVDPASRGLHRVSSDVGLRTLAAAAQESAVGLPVGINWVLKRDSFANMTTSEATPGPDSSFTGDDGRTYSNNAYQWPYMCRTGHADPLCVQNIGVAAAWSAMEGAGKLSNRTRVAIWDSGFDPNDDFPAGAQILPPNPPGPAPGGPGTCDGIPCPFHGTNVLMAGMAVPDNNFGAAGPGGPVADAALVRSPADIFDLLDTLTDYLGSVSDGQILNISAGVPIPKSLCLIACTVADGFFGSLRLGGILVFASAGNDRANVDERDSFGPFSWEAAGYVPCESSGVICVGGLDWNSKMRHPHSNWGSDSTNPSETSTVRMFGPHAVWIYDAHQVGAPAGVTLGYGTSYASPFVAGVAALVWAVNPNLGADDVERILFSTAHSSPDSTVPRYVNAFGAVLSALGGHVPPSILIDSPAGNPTVHVGDLLSFHAIAINQDDFTNISSQIHWTSTVAADGPFPTGASFFPTHDLSVGTRTFTASISINGFTRTASVTVNVIPVPIVLRIAAPSNGQTFFVNDTARLVGEATRNGLSLPAAQVSWTLHDPAGHATALGAGFSLITPALATAGNYRIEFTAVGATQPVSVNITVFPTPGPPPTVSIQSPTAGMVVDAYLVGQTPQQIPVYEVDLTLRGQAVDHNGVALTGNSLTWHQENLAGSGIGHGTTVVNASIQVHIRGMVSLPIFLVAEDAQHATAQASVTIQVVTHDLPPPPH